MLALIFIVFNIALPLLIIFGIIKLAARVFGLGHKGEQHELSDRDVVQALLGASAGFAALLASFHLPSAIYTDASEEQIFPIYLIEGVIFLLIGLTFRQNVGKMLMIVGVILLLASLPTIFTEVGSVGIFFIVIAAFVALIYAALRFSRKAGSHEN